MSNTLVSRRTTLRKGDRKPAHNSTYPKVAGQCEYEHLRFKQTFVHIDSLVFQNRHLRVAANRYQQA